MHKSPVELAAVAILLSHPDKEDLAANGPDGSAPVASALQEPLVASRLGGVKARVRSPLGPPPRSGGRRSIALHQQRGGRAAMRKSHRRGRLCRHHLEPHGERRLAGRRSA